ncbi:TniB family NTP-binding protein [Sphingomonas panni]|uniref:TniB family NTP-binding protein n=1 Tax=Sphingomonas panni TaxID=237612 RepID=UPI001F5B4D34|nr:TniB family NTP-binding protein [Sphingomonas panni]
MTDPAIPSDGRPRSGSITTTPAAPGSAPWPSNGGPALSGLASAFGLGDRSRRVGRAVADVTSMRLPYPPQLAAMGDFAEAMHTGDALRASGCGRHVGCLLLDPTGCGKTTAARAYVELMSADAEPGTIPAVYARVPQNGTAIGLYTSILSRLGDHHVNISRENKLFEHVVTRLTEAGTRILFLDEADKSPGTNPAAGRIAGSTVSVARLLMDEGVVPVVLLGTELGTGSIADDKELAGRLLAPTSLSPLVWHDDYDRGIWIDLLAELDRRLTQGVCDRPYGLGDEEVAETLMTAANGTIGQLMGIVRSAVREMARADRSHLLKEDLVYAIDSWSVGYGYIMENPLR